MGKDKIMEHNTRVEQIKTYLERLSAGEELEKVRADFAKEFKEVDPAEIMQAEQELLQGGTPLETVQKLCDVHAALFRGATSEEKVANAEKAVAASVKEKKLAATAALTGITGHPLQTFTRENEALENIIQECREEVENTKIISPELFGKLREVAIHYAKKGDLLYPHLKVKYGISGPSDVMWTTDDEIRDELADLQKCWPFAKRNAGQSGKKLTDTETKWMERFIVALQRVEDMIYKEANIFFPNCALNFTEEEWFGIYRDSKDYPVCFGVENATWDCFLYVSGEITDGMAVFTVKDDGVGMSQEQLEKLMGTEEEPDHEAERTHTHLGVYAVRKRLDYVYQNKARMSITSEPGKGTQVILEIPMNGNVGVTYRKYDETVNENNKKGETRDNGIAGNDIR